MSTQIQNFATLLIDGIAFETFPDSVTEDPGLPEIKEVVTIGPGGVSVVNIAPDITTAMAMIKAEIPHKAGLRAQLEAIKARNAKGQTSTVVLIKPDGTNSTYRNAFIRNKIEAPYSADGKITVEIAASTSFTFQ